MAIGTPTTLGTKAENVTSGTLTIVTSAAVPANGKIVCWFSWVGAQTLSSFAGGGLTWRIAKQLQSAGTNGTYNLAVVEADAPAGLVISTTLTATFSANTTHGLISAAYVTGVVTGSPLKTVFDSRLTAVTSWSIGTETNYSGDYICFAAALSDAAGITSSPSSDITELHDFNDASFLGALTTAYRSETDPGSRFLNGTWSAAGGNSQQIIIEILLAGSALKVGPVGIPPRNGGWAYQDTGFQDGTWDVTNDAFQQAAGERLGYPTLTQSTPASGISAAGAIASGQAFGTTKIQRQVREDGTGIASGAAVGQPKLFIQVGNAGGIATGQGVGQPKLFLRLAPIGIASGAAVGTPRLLVVTAAGGISTGAVFGTTKVQRQVREDGTGIATGVAFGRPVIGNFNPSVSGVGAIATGELFGTAKLFIRVGPTGIVSTVAFGTAAVQRQVREDGTGIASQAAVGKPLTGHQIGPAGIASGAQVGTPRTIRPTQVGGIASAVAFGTPALASPQPTVVDSGGGKPTHAAPRTLYIVPDRQDDQDATERPDPLPVGAAGGIPSGEAFGRPTLTLLPPPPRAIDALALEQELVDLGIFDIAV